MKADNKTKTLQTDSNADLIFKKGDYVHTYIVIETSGLPNGATLYLLDENLNQLYSPYDVNANQVKTPCTITIGETDALQLPANYIDNEYTDFNAGTYNWKLKYHDITGKTFEDKIIPITIKIVDFEIETIQEIYPNEDIQVQLKTWVNTAPSLNDFDIDRLTTNAVYDDTTGIITYPNNDINDLTVGQHIQTINQYELNYTIKNPIYAVVGTGFLLNNKTSFSYEENIWFGVAVSDYSRVGRIYEGKSRWSMGYIKGLNVDKYVGYTHSGAYGRATSKERYETIILAPGHYLWTTEYNTENCHNEFYYDEKGFEITTQDCAITLSQDEDNIIATYLYNNTTPIPNASIQMLKDNNIIDTLITNSNGQCSVPKDSGTFIAKAIDFDGSILLSSNTLEISFDIIISGDKNVLSAQNQDTATLMVSSDAITEQNVGIFVYDSNKIEFDNEYIYILIECEDENWQYLFNNSGIVITDIDKETIIETININTYPGAIMWDSSQKKCYKSEFMQNEITIDSITEGFIGYLKIPYTNAQVQGNAYLRSTTLNNQWTYNGGYGNIKLKAIAISYNYQNNEYTILPYNSNTYIITETE